MSAANEIHRPRPPEEIVREVEVEIDRDHPDISTEKRTFLRAVLVQNKIEQEIAKFNGSLPKELRQFLTASEKHSERKRFELGGKIYGFGQGLLFAYAISAMMSKGWALLSLRRACGIIAGIIQT